MSLLNSNSEGDVDGASNFHSKRISFKNKMGTTIFDKRGSNQ